MWPNSMSSSPPIWLRSVANGATGSGKAARRSRLSPQP
jgi:hypothetical protein